MPFFNKFKKSFSHAVSDVGHIATSPVSMIMPHQHGSTHALPPILEGVVDAMNPINQVKTIVEIVKNPEKRKKVGDILEKVGGACGMIATVQPEFLPICAGIEVGGIALDVSGKAHDSIKSGDYTGAVKEIAIGVGKLSGKMGDVLGEEQKEELQLEKIGSVASKINKGIDKLENTSINTNGLIDKMLKIDREEQIEDKHHNAVLDELVANTKSEIEHQVQQDKVLDGELKAQQSTIDQEEGIIASQQETIEKLINKPSGTGNSALDFVLNNFERFERLPQSQKDKILKRLIDAGAIGQLEGLL